MFAAAELGHVLDKEQYKIAADQLRQQLLTIQYQLKDRADFPVVILLGGVPTAGRGQVANLLLEWMDPRLIATHAFSAPNDEERARPPYWRYWRVLPPKGKMAILFGGWYSGPMWDQLTSQPDSVQYEHELGKIIRLETMLADEGALVLKFWLHLPKEQLKKRLKKYANDPLTSWRFDETDLWFLDHYDEVMASQQDLLQRTNLADAPWRVIESSDERYRDIAVGTHILEAITHHMERTSVRQKRVNAAPLMPSIDGVRLLDRLPLDADLSKESYNEQLEELQGRLNGLTRHPDFKKYSVVCVFEGMDAAGKGGAIRRITAALDARQYRTIPIAAPTEEERAQPYLWRFWRHIPPHGQITLFDRSWYGRVLVERVEDFASRADWMRAYGEINDFEAQISLANVIVVKFWLAISSEEQLRRFKEREEIEYKRFKITDEDWRNREKWDAYIEAGSDLIERTSTAIAPWHMVGANNKYYARLEVLRHLCERIEAALGPQKAGKKRKAT
ncbi:polyphosphate:AMP phosphotransferase [Chitinibacter bivalviorum]|uniref:Polyphosphate:AMP phosphotransferase n=1 Tax=Chitinibacter bivalviorum TaxID=2739434 RepID=A0A7H9BN93_9NEIS|nr:polyphosphate:AMP phosphotransferase [Chitinibacter bivalviorum]QLG89698.1 polyphosphate:AMP phosphotransferase [Chitinibacter bivalviorum]